MNWYSYYPSLFPKMIDTFHTFNDKDISLHHYVQFVAMLRANEIESIWIPGCAHTLLTHALFYSGFHVIASDIDSDVVLMQKTYNSTPLKDRITREGLLGSGSLEIKIESFDNPLCANCIDMVMLFANLEILPQNTIMHLSKSLFGSLNKRGILLSDTSSFGFATKVFWEKLLCSEGFKVPTFQVNKWCYESLEKTGAQYRFVLDYPTVLREGKYEYNRVLWERDYLAVIEIADQYRERKRLIQTTISIDRNQRIAVVL